MKDRRDLLERDHDISFWACVMSILSAFVMLICYGKDCNTIAFKLRDFWAVSSIISYLMAVIFEIRTKNVSILKQCFFVSILMTIISTIVLCDFSSNSRYAEISDLIVRLSFFIGFLLGTIVQGVFLYRTIMQRKITFDVSKIGRWIYGHSLIILLVIIISIHLIVTYGNTMPPWDAGLLYYYSAHSTVDMVFDMQSAFYCQHISYIYSAIIAICYSLFQNIDFALFFVFSIVYIISVICFYGIIKIIVPQRSDFSYTLSTSLYAFSPFVLGMIHDPYLDLFTLMMFVILLYCVFSKQVIWEIFCMFCIVFTKEPAAIAVGFMIVGLLITDYINTKGDIKTRIIGIFRMKKYLSCALVFAIWIYLYLFVCHWSKTGDSTSWSVTFLINRLKLVLGLNFNWIIILGAAFFIIHSIKDWKRNAGYIVPLIFTYFSMLIFLLVFPTHNHSRYLGILIVPPYVLCAAGLCTLSKKKVRTSIQVVLALLILISTLKTIDPVTRKIFNAVNIGNDTMITTDETFSDSIVYNSQYEGYQKAINKAISEILKSEYNAKIFLPALNGNAWSYDALGNWTAVDKCSEITEYWNNARNVRSFVQGSGFSPLEITFISDDMDSSIITDGQTGHFLYLSYTGEVEADRLRKVCRVIDEKSYEVDGWVVKDLAFTKK